MKRRNDIKKLGLTRAAIRELKPADFERTSGGAVSGNIGVISPISPISPVIPVTPVTPVVPIVIDPVSPIAC